MRVSQQIAAEHREFAAHAPSAGAGHGKDDRLTGQSPENDWLRAAKVLQARH